LKVFAFVQIYLLKFVSLKNPPSILLSLVYAYFEKNPTNKQKEGETQVLTATGKDIAANTWVIDQ